MGDPSTYGDRYEADFQRRKLKRYSSKNLIIIIIIIIVIIIVNFQEVKNKPEKWSEKRLPEFTSLLSNVVNSMQPGGQAIW